MLAEWAIVPLLILVFGGLLMPGWRSLLLWLVICTSGLTALWLALSRGSGTVLGASVYSIYYLMTLAALFGGGLVKTIVLLLRRRAKQ